jgi:hypothetical protein
MVMRMRVCVESSSPTLHVNLADQAGYDQGVQSVVHSGAGRLRVPAIDRAKHIFGRRVNRMPQDVTEDRPALRRAAKSAPFEGGFHAVLQFRQNLNSR